MAALRARVASGVSDLTRVEGGKCKIQQLSHRPPIVLRVKLESSIGRLRWFGHVERRDENRTIQWGGLVKNRGLGGLKHTILGI